MDDSTLEYYTAHWDELIPRYESADMSDLHSLLVSGFSPGSRILELGCGSGREAAFMLAKGFDVTAADGVQEMIDAAQRCHPELSGRLCRIRLPGDLDSLFGPYDGVYSIATLMHLTRPAIKDVFLRIRDILNSRGRLFFSVPFKRHDVKDDEFDIKGRRFTGMTMPDWAEICRTTGFDIIESSRASDGLGRPEIGWLNCLAQCAKK
ncbi:MAG: class I SAM-dependent methyltransferase [Desulfobacteraceae bacterium]